MKTLFLVRHAHATDGPADHDRPLSTAGSTEAQNIASQLASFTPRPQLILSSPARRTMETAATLQRALNNIPLETDASLYLADTYRLMEAITRLPDSNEHALLVAHNPGLGQLAFDLGGGAHPLIARGFAPATVAVFETEATSWRALHRGNTRLRTAFAPVL